MASFCVVYHMTNSCIYTINDGKFCSPFFSSIVFFPVVVAYPYLPLNFIDMTFWFTYCAIIVLLQLLIDRVVFVSCC
jgi:hypothetical protein